MIHTKGPNPTVIFRDAGAQSCPPAQPPPILLSLPPPRDHVFISFLRIFPGVSSCKYSPVFLVFAFSRRDHVLRTLSPRCFLRLAIEPEQRATRGSHKLGPVLLGFRVCCVLLIVNMG